MKNEEAPKAVNNSNEVELDSEMTALIDSLHDQLGKTDLFTLLEVDLNASAEVLRRAYFRRSRLFHPDRYFKRKLGPYKKKLECVFAWLAAGYEFLKDDRRRAGYRKRILNIRDGGAISIGSGGCLVAVETPGGLEFRITDEAAFFAADEAPTLAEAGARSVGLPQHQYALPRIRSMTPAQELPVGDSAEAKVADPDAVDRELRALLGEDDQGE